MQQLQKADGVLIDGCLVPGEVYEYVRKLAVESGKVQFIGVTYRSDSRFEPGMARVVLMFADLKRGHRCSFLIGYTRDELLATQHPVSILWITPQAEPMA
jgi:hypothetical protein